MVKLGLACNGEGFGHVSRMVTFYEALKDRYQLVLFAPRTVHDFLRCKAPDAKVVEVPHMHLAKVADRINYYRTFSENLSTFLHLRRNIVRVSALLKESGIRALINDYEPFSAMAAGRNSIPVLQFNHPGIVINSPSISPAALAAKLLARFMMPNFDRRIFVSFYNGDVGPMIRRELAEAPLSCGDYYLVSLKESYRKPVLKKLHRMGIRNYRLFPNPGEDYVEAVAGCKAIITSAGHQTLSEALHMKKPVFAIPQKGQFEQLLNARMLAASGRGNFGSIRNLESSLTRFIRDLDAGRFPGSANPFVKFNFSNESERIIARIEHFVRNASTPLNAPFWNFIFPDRKSA